MAEEKRKKDTKPGQEESTTSEEDNKVKIVEEGKSEELHPETKSEDSEITPGKPEESGKIPVKKHLKRSKRKTRTKQQRKEEFRRKKEDEIGAEMPEEGTGPTTSEEEGKVEIVEEKYRPRIKPVLDPEINEMLEKKKEIKLPAFKRQEWFRYKRLGDHWRRPKGLHSKMRTHMGYRPPVVRVGYRTPSRVRGFHPSGFREVLIYNPSDLEGINPEKEAVRIGSTVGTRKRIDIIEKADRLNLRVLNRRGL